ncbi:hypothetical protein EDD86DRAFT_5684 [Gorgonomyces haynaldii]|nr:hypothetical protein EDD86DRAFT_5684 [Gorgonomyces haynaldii]
MITFSLKMTALSVGVSARSFLWDPALSQGMSRGTLPEGLQEVRGLVYSPASQNLSGQMAIAFALASPADRKKFKRRSRSSKCPESQYWLRAAQHISSHIGVQGQMTLDDFELVVDLCPNMRIVVYSSQTNQPAR